MKMKNTGLFAIATLVAGLSACAHHDVRTDVLPMDMNALAQENQTVAASDAPDGAKALFQRFVQRATSGQASIVTPGMTVVDAIDAEKRFEADVARQQAAQQQAATQHAAEQQELARISMTAVTAPNGDVQVTLHNGSGQRIECFDGSVQMSRNNYPIKETAGFFFQGNGDDTDLGINSDVTVPLTDIEDANAVSGVPFDALDKAYTPIAVQFQGQNLIYRDGVSFSQHCH